MPRTTRAPAQPGAQVWRSTSPGGGTQREAQCNDGGPQRLRCATAGRVGTLHLVHVAHSTRHRAWLAWSRKSRLRICAPPPLVATDSNTSSTHARRGARAVRRCVTSVMAAGFQKCRNVTPAPPGRGSVRSRLDPNWSRIAKRRIPRYAGGRAVRPAAARLSRLGLADGLWRVGGAPQAQVLTVQAIQAFKSLLLQP